MESCRSVFSWSGQQLWSIGQISKHEHMYLYLVHESHVIRRSERAEGLQNWIEDHASTGSKRMNNLTSEAMLRRAYGSFAAECSSLIARVTSSASLFQDFTRGYRQHPLILSIDDLRWTDRRNVWLEICLRTTIFFLMIYHDTPDNFIET